MGSLKHIEIEKFDVVFIFVGAKQPIVSFQSRQSDKLVDIKVLKIKNVANNNLDFHLSYYLGKMDGVASKSVGFTVISNDKGYDGLINHINSMSRSCSRQKNESEATKLINKIISELLKKESNKLPKTEATLKNYIRSGLGQFKSEHNVQIVYKVALRQKKIANRINSPVKEIA